MPCELHPLPDWPEHLRCVLQLPLTHQGPPELPHPHKADPDELSEPPSPGLGTVTVRWTVNDDQELGQGESAAHQLNLKKKKKKKVFLRHKLRK